MHPMGSYSGTKCRDAPERGSRNGKRRNAGTAEPVRKRHEGLRPDPARPKRQRKEKKRECPARKLASAELTPSQSRTDVLSCFSFQSPDQPEVGDDHISVHDSSGDESDATQRKSRSRSEQKKSREETCPGPWWQKQLHYQTGYIVFGFAASSADRRQKRRSTSPRPDVVGEDGLLADINVQPIIQPKIQTNGRVTFLWQKNSQARQGWRR
ncbi:hypothetical protein B0H14DRAFT_2575908 [Mycena olivaceomarginata]|nr:hypothetical protein B0H14DRAFT_2575908 [Mycena olivaceomarginata]